MAKKQVHRGRAAAKPKKVVRPVSEPPPRWDVDSAIAPKSDRLAAARAEARGLWGVPEPGPGPSSQPWLNPDARAQAAALKAPPPTMPPPGPGGGLMRQGPVGMSPLQPGPNPPMPPPSPPQPQPQPPMGIGAGDTKSLGLYNPAGPSQPLTAKLLPERPTAAAGHELPYLPRQEFLPPVPPGGAPPGPKWSPPPDWSPSQGPGLPADRPFVPPPSMPPAAEARSFGQGVPFRAAPPRSTPMNGAFMGGVAGAAPPGGPPWSSTNDFFSGPALHAPPEPLNLANPAGFGSSVPLGGQSLSAQVREVNPGSFGPRAAPSGSVPTMAPPSAPAMAPGMASQALSQAGRLGRGALGALGAVGSAANLADAAGNASDIATGPDPFGSALGLAGNAASLTPLGAAATMTLSPSPISPDDPSAFESSKPLGLGPDPMQRPGAPISRPTGTYSSAPGPWASALGPTSGASALPPQPGPQPGVSMKTDPSNLPPPADPFEQIARALLGPGATPEAIQAFIQRNKQAPPAMGSKPGFNPWDVSGRMPRQ